MQLSHRQSKSLLDRRTDKRTDPHMDIKRALTHIKTMEKTKTGWAGGEGRELKGEEEEDKIGEERSSDIRRELLCRRRIKNRRMKKGGGESLVFPLLISFSSVSPRISTAWIRPSGPGSALITDDYIMGGQTPFYIIWKLVYLWSKKRSFRMPHTLQNEANLYT